MIIMILLCVAYCITWWIGPARGYWIALTLLEILFVFINVSVLGFLAKFKEFPVCREAILPELCPIWP